jgi:hypothetical protein
VFELVDPCDPPISITATGWEPQEYTLTADSKSYSHPEVVIDPDFCPYKVEYTIQNLPNEETAITQPDSDEGTFVILYQTGLYPLDKEQQVDAVFTSESVYGENNTPVTEEASFKLSFNSPCVDPDFVSIKGITLPNLDYAIDQGSQTYDPHDLFAVSTVPIDHNFCGDLTVTPTYEGAPLEGGEPLTYDPATKSFTFESDEQSLEN